MELETISLTVIVVCGLIAFFISVTVIFDLRKSVKKMEKLSRGDLRMDYAKWVSRKFFTNKVEASQVIEEIDKTKKRLFTNFLLAGVMMIIAGFLAALTLFLTHSWSIVIFPFVLLFFPGVILPWQLYQKFVLRYAKFKEIALHEHYIALKLLQDRDNLQ